VAAHGELGAPLRGVMAVVAGGAAITILDSTIVNVALDRLAVAFGAQLGTIQWVATAYLLAVAAVIPVSGWGVERFGARRVMLTALSAFVAASALCASAWSAGSLIAFRVLQGLGGGLVMPVGMTMLARAAGPERMGRVMSVVGIPMLLAPILGPVLGGALVDAGSWRLIFLVNLPLGAATLALASRVLPRGRAAADTRLDVIGLALLSPGLVSLAGGLSARTGGIGVHAGLLAAGIGLIAAFAVHAWHAPAPLIDVRIFRRRAVAAAAATIALFGAAFFGSLLLLALYFQAGRGHSALAAGLLLAPQGAGAMLTMPVAGKMTDRAGPGAIVLAGIVLAVAGTLPFAFVGQGVPAPLLAAGMFLRGAGMGATLMPAMAAAYQALPTAAVARAASALEIVQRAGASLGIALLAALLEHGVRSRVPGFAGLAAVDRLGPAARAGLESPFAASAADAFAWAIALTALSLLPALLLPRRALHTAAIPERAAA
jgi:EmrB/QacA subfamily drug resistance transporter